jgi:hypothetical protein
VPRIAAQSGLRFPDRHQLPSAVGSIPEENLRRAAISPPRQFRSHPNGPSIYISPIVSLIEELDAIDWYRRRADDIAEETLKELLPHNMREEMEHAWMLLEWIRAARQRL